MKLTVVIVKACHCYYVHTKVCQNSSWNCCGLSVWTESNRSTTVYAAFVCEVLEKKWECSGAIQQLLVGHTKACDSVRGKALFNILI